MRCTWYITSFQSIPLTIRNNTQVHHNVMANTMMQKMMFKYISFASRSLFVTKLAQYFMAKKVTMPINVERIPVANCSDKRLLPY
jgi:hypothetical protein